VPACFARAPGTLAAWSPRVGRRGGALTDGPVVASGRQGIVGELMGTTRRAPGKEGADGAHRGRRSTVRRGGGVVRRRVAGSSLEGGSTATLGSSWSY
jgi:hypothetical protein